MIPARMATDTFAAPRFGPEAGVDVVGGLDTVAGTAALRRPKLHATGGSGASVATSCSALALTRSKCRVLLPLNFRTGPLGLIGG